MTKHFNYCQRFLTKYGCHTLEWDFTKPAVFVASFSKAKGKIQKNIVSHKGVGEPWAHSAKGTSLFVYEVSNPVGQNWNRQMCRNQNISPSVLIQMSQSTVCPCHPLSLWPAVVSLVWVPCRLEWEGILLMSSWWSYSPTRPTHSLCSPCMESQQVNHWPSRESPVCSR